MAVQRRIRWTAYFAPIIFLFHVAEEAPGFVEWFNSLVARGITQSLFLSVNVTAFIITIMISGMLTTIYERTIAVLMLAWLGFLMLANAVFHLVGTLAHARYSPGLVTAMILYLPYFGWFFWLAVRHLRIPLIMACASTLLGSAPMVIHGYLIVFRGDRLF
ncbi:MAG: HXXEE domain-containing protein [Ignavibacteriales bacterium]|nr:HXXEE domain-containing protein [Ignavibacteriales bacterium]